MRKISTLIIAIVLTTSILAQSPQKMSYQAVIRNGSDQLVTNHAVGMRISILREATPVYVETQTPTSNANGLVSIEIGAGIIVTGTFAGIDWSNGTYFIKTETDPNGGTSYSITGASQIVSVPYALYAKTSEKADELEFKLQKLSNSMIAGMVTDIDGNSYNTVKIGTQVWMSESLKTTKYSDGDLIGTTTPATLDISLETTPKYQWAYNGNENNVANYGRLYTWYAATDSRNICPMNWHVPSVADWTTLENNLIANGYNWDGTTTGNKIGKSMAATSGWTTSGTLGEVGNDQKSNNKTGYSALPSGVRKPDGSFNVTGNFCFLWSSIEFSTGDANYREIYYGYSGLNNPIISKKHGLSIRCLRD